MGTTIVQASVTSSVISSTSSIAVLAWTQLNRRSAAGGRRNVSGSLDQCRALLLGEGEPHERLVPGERHEDQLLDPNFTRSWIRCSVVRGRLRATRRTSSTVTMSDESGKATDNAAAVHLDDGGEVTSPVLLDHGFGAPPPALTSGSVDAQRGCEPVEDGVRSGCGPH